MKFEDWILLTITHEEYELLPPDEQQYVDDYVWWFNETFDRY
jgi:hypothetical protein